MLPESALRNSQIETHTKKEWRLIESTKAVISNAMRLVEQADTDTSQARYVRVRDPKTGQLFSLFVMSDEYVSGQYAYRRNNGLIITPLSLNRNGVLEPKREEVIQLPDNPSHHIVGNLDFSTKGLKPRTMKSVARMLGRAERVG
ncbi:hypothetical protein A3F29_00635 [Candidatus Roizmanbacteria bacterium RIFCSPHIGHO2_12_FULL_33_9]|uniref:Uncharacterized protein n=1 Tax=Candidatus Roizmanbacteria bacterium RIFCSPHIGHO2_12_FULL_33_9 TaxID=1802045 RepID=A0A1F7HI93_9BACT|nr:MAG: hypothetical protein A3F29_00635 [Candidatus Roizmanbacteria bacterium RIFCSPHIGHO2_12_FULL_33_9]